MKIKNRLSNLKLTGRRIILRPLKFSDTLAIYSNLQDQKIAEQMRLIPQPFKLSDAKDFIRESKKFLRAKKALTWGIELKAQKKIVGCVSLYDLDQRNEIEHEIDYWLGEKYRGQGLLVETLDLVFNFAFKKLKIHRIWAEVFGDNFTSQKILKKLGFKKEGYHREAYWHASRWRDSVHYGLLSQEFLRSKKKIFY